MVWCGFLGRLRWSRLPFRVCKFQLRRMLFQGRYRPLDPWSSVLPEQLRLWLLKKLKIGQVEVKDTRWWRERKEERKSKKKNYAKWRCTAGNCRQEHQRRDEQRRHGKSWHVVGWFLVVVYWVRLLSFERDCANTKKIWREKKIHLKKKKEPSDSSTKSWVCCFFFNFGKIIPQW